MDNAYGPSLPPGFKLPVDEESDSEQPQKKAKIIGPQVPAFLASKLPEVDEPHTSKIIGPVLPGMCTESSEDDDNEVYGPMPSDSKLDYDIVGIIEKRAADMKNKLENKDIPAVESTQREEWMVVPDTTRRNQLGAISRCLAPGSKVQKKKDTEYYNPEEDEKTTKELKKYNKSKRGESLLDMHRKKKKKEKKEKKSEKKERKAFDREEIGTRLFNKEQVNSVIDKSKYLNSRFAPGRSQYL